MAITTKAVAGMANLQPDIWAKEVGLEATSRRVLADLVDRIDFSGPGDVMNFEQLPDIAATQVAAGAAVGVGSLTPSTVPTPTQRTMTPLFAYVFVQIERDLMNRWLSQTESAVQKRMGISLANQVEIDIAKMEAAVPASNQFGAAGTPFALAELVKAMGAIWQNGGDLVTQGVDRAYAVYHASNWDDFMQVGVGTGTFLSAATRGEANGPARTGKIQTTFGFDVDFTGHIQLNTAAPRNLLFTEGAILLGIKEEPEILIQPFEMSTKIIAVIDYGVTLLWPVLAARHWCAA